MNLYEIADVYQIALQSSVDPETGEISEQTLAQLDEIGNDLQEKANNVGAYIGNLEAQANAIREAERKMADRRKAIDRQVDRLREYLRSNMERCGISEITNSPYFSIRLKKCPPSVEVVNEMVIPSRYFRVKQEVDRLAIARAIKNGVEVPGARLVADKMRVDIK